MARYALSNAGTAITTQQNMTTTYKTLVTLSSATGATTLRRAWLYDIMVGTDGTPADNAMSFIVNRQTSVGTVTVLAPLPLDFGDAACLTTGGINTTIEGIVTDNSALVQIGMNQRASYRWVAAPGGELIMPAVNVAGIGVRAKSPAYASTATATVNLWE